MKNNIAVLVISCDSYSDLWDPFFKLFFKYWGNCQFKIYLSSNNKDFIHEKVTSLKSNEVSDWSSELKIILDKIQEEHLIVILEDYFIYKDVDINALQYVIKSYFTLEAVFLRLGAFPKFYNHLWPGNKIEKFPGILKINKGAEYRLNLQTALWNKNYLRNILNEGESPWEFEIEASKRSNLDDSLILALEPQSGKYDIHGPITYYGGAITKGHWMRRAIKIAKQNNIALDLSHRQVESHYRYYRRRIYTSLPFFVRIIIDKILSILSIKNS